MLFVANVVCPYILAPSPLVQGLARLPLLTKAELAPAAPAPPRPQRRLSEALIVQSQAMRQLQQLQHTQAQQGHGAGQGQGQGQGEDPQEMRLDHNILAIERADTEVLHSQASAPANDPEPAAPPVTLTLARSPEQSDVAEAKADLKSAANPDHDDDDEFGMTEVFSSSAGPLSAAKPHASAARPQATSALAPLPTAKSGQADAFSVALALSIRGAALLNEVGAGAGANASAAAPAGTGVAHAALVSSAPPSVAQPQTPAGASAARRGSAAGVVGAAAAGRSTPTGAMGDTLGRSPASHIPLRAAAGLLRLADKFRLVRSACFRRTV